MEAVLFFLTRREVDGGVSMFQEFLQQKMLVVSLSKRGCG
jgi:hypothetical protein